MSKYHTGNISKWNKVYIHVSSLEQAKMFYTTIMGFVLKRETSDVVVVGDKDHELIELTETNASQKNQEGQYHIAFLLSNDTVLASWLHHVINKQYPLGGSAHHGVSKAIYLEDPFGNGIEVYSDTKPSSWDRENNQVKMGAYPLDVNELLTLQQPFTSFDIVYIGHIHLRVKDIEPMATFYSKFGLETTFNLGSALFASFQGYHHHIAFNTWGMRTAESFESNNIGLYQIDLEVVEEDIKDEKIKEQLNKKEKLIMKDPIGITIQIHKGEQR